MKCSRVPDTIVKEVQLGWLPAMEFFFFSGVPRY